MSYSSGNDKAIEFQAELLKTKKMIKNLTDIGISMDIYKRRIEKIVELLKTNIEKEMLSIESSENMQTLNKMYKETHYINAISEIKKVQISLEKYSDYFSAYYYCKSLEKEISSSCQITNEQLSQMVDNILSFIKKINYSNTEDYDSEKEIVEKLYHIAYLVMKLEFRITGKSRIFDVAKSDHIVTNYMNEEIQKDIDTIHTVPNNIEQVKSSGIDCDYLDEAILIYLSIFGENQDIDSIKKELLILHDNICKQQEKLHKMSEDYRFKKSDSLRYRDKYKKGLGKKLLNYALIVSILLSAAGIGTGLGKLAGTKKSYKTEKETYSTYDDSLISEELYLRDNISGEQTFIRIYQPWKKRLGEFERKYVSYDVSEIQYDNLSEYLDLDLKELGIDGTKFYDQKDSLTPEDLYESAIYEVVHLIQDSEDVVIEENNRVFFLFLVLSMVVSVTISASIMRKIKELNQDIKSDKLSYKSNLIHIKELLERYKELYRTNEQFREKFDVIFNSIKPYLNEKEVKKLILLKRPEQL